MTVATFQIDAGARLIRALERDAAVLGVSIAVVDSCERPWASATFTGSRHRLTLGVAGAAADAWLAALPDTDLPVRGRLVADLVARRVTTEGAVLDVLLLDAA